MRTCALPDAVAWVDGVLPPWSSRLWPFEGYVEGADPPSYDKQFVRDWLEEAKVNGAPWNKRAPAPQLPPQVVALTAARYAEALQRLMGSAQA